MRIWNPIDFQGHRSKVKVTGSNPCNILVNTLSTSFNGFWPNLVNTYSLWESGTLLIFKVIGQRSRSQGLIFTTERPSSVVRRPSSVRPLNFHILINSSEATGPIWTKLWWNGPWMAPFQNCVRWSRLPTKMAAKLKIEKRGDEILIVHCCFSISQNEPQILTAATWQGVV